MIATLIRIVAPGTNSGKAIYRSVVGPMDPSSRVLAAIRDLTARPRGGPPSSSDVAAQLDCDKATVNRVLAELVDARLVARIGRGRAARLDDLAHLE